MHTFMLQRQYENQWEDIQQWAEKSLKGQWMWGSRHMNPRGSYLNEDDQGTMFIDKDEDAVLFALRWK